MTVQMVTPMTRGDRILIVLEDHRKLSAIAAEFEGCKSIKTTDTNRLGETRLYDGYTELADIRRADGTVRVTLEKP